MRPTCAGAPPPTRVIHRVRFELGWEFIQIYGLTETSPLLTINRTRSEWDDLEPEERAGKLVRAGAPALGCRMRVDDESGEVLARSNVIMEGYHDLPKETERTFAGGWFHTGDIGELDEDGYLTITGRKKEILVTAGGKNVAPAVLEDRLRAHPLVSQCMVVGDQRPFIAALVTLDPEMLPGWAANNGLGGISIEDARTNEKVLGAIQDAVDDANNAVSKAESIRKFIVLEGDFTEDSGHLTPSLKLKRSVVMRDYANAIEDIYG